MNCTATHLIMQVCSSIKPLPKILSMGHKKYSNNYYPCFLLYSKRPHAILFTKLKQTHLMPAIIVIFSKV